MVRSSTLPSRRSGQWDLVGRARIPLHEDERHHDLPMPIGVAEMMCHLYGQEVVFPEPHILGFDLALKGGFGNCRRDVIGHDAVDRL